MYAIAGLIVLYLSLKYLAIWSAFSGLALAASSFVFIKTRSPQRSGNPHPQPYDVLASALIFAFQVFGAGLATLVLGTVLVKHIADGSALNALIGIVFLLMCCLLAQRQAKKLFKQLFWQPRLMKIPLGIASQLFLVSIFLSAIWLSTKIFPERHERQRTVTPINPFSAQVETIRLRPSSVWLSIPSNHLYSIREDYLPAFRQTFSSRMQTEITVEFLFPSFGTRNQENEAAFRNLDYRDRLTIRIKPSAIREGLSLKKEWEIMTGMDTGSTPAIAAGQASVEASGGRRNVSITQDNDLQLTAYSVEGHIWKWFTSGEHVIRCMVKSSSVALIGQPCNAEKVFTNGVVLFYTFPYSRLAQWNEIDVFVNKVFSSYANRNQDE